VDDIGWVLDGQWQGGGLSLEPFIHHSGGAIVVFQDAKNRKGEKGPRSANHRKKKNLACKKVPKGAGD